MENWRCEGILAGCVSIERTRWVLPAILCAGVDRRSISSLDLPAMVADLLGVVHGTPLGDGFLSNSIFSADDIVGWFASCPGGRSNRSVDSTYEQRASGNTG